MRILGMKLKLFHPARLPRFGDVNAKKISQKRIVNPSKTENSMIIKMIY
jgi:hypothetical protein